MDEYVSPEATKKYSIKAKVIRVDNVHAKPKLSITLPVKTISELNSTEHWTAKAKRHRMQKWVLKAYWPSGSCDWLPCRVLLTRLAPKELDAHDNLPASCKWLVDQISALLTGVTRAGQGDADPRIKWEYAQEFSSTYKVRIEIFEI